MKLIKNTAPDFPEEDLPNYDIIHGVIGRLSAEINQKLDDFIVEGLKRKGFEFKNGSELREFVTLRCRCEDDLSIKKKTFFVDDIPFFLHNYNTEIIKSTMDIDEPFKITGDLGSYAYL